MGLVFSLTILRDQFVDDLGLLLLVVALIGGG